MNLIKRGKYWGFDFQMFGQRYQGSTYQTNKNKAHTTLDRIRSEIALGHFGIIAPKSVPFREFLEMRFLEHVHRHAKARRTKVFYAQKVKRLLEFDGWRNLNLAEITEEWIGKYADWRLRSGRSHTSGRAKSRALSGNDSQSPRSANLSIATINGELATLRKALNLALEWQLIQRRPRVRRLPGEKPRSFVVSAELEAQFLAAASYPLKQAAVLILDCGLRPEECVSLRKADISDSALQVRDGKTVNARRIVPMTQRGREVLSLLFALFPDSEWLFPGRKGQHFGRQSLDNRFTKLRDAQGWPQEFVLHNLRHTFATRLAESGANPFEIARLMGHSSIAMTSRYTHPEAHSLALAMARKEALDRIRRGELDHEEVPEKASKN